MDKVIILAGVVEWFTNHITLYAEESLNLKVQKSIKALVALVLSAVLVIATEASFNISGNNTVDTVLSVGLIAFGSRAIHEFYKVFNRK